MNNPVETPFLSIRALALAGVLLGGALAACQSAPVTSKEPPASASMQPAAQAPAKAAPAAPLNEPAAVKLTGAAPSGGAPSPAAPSQAAPAAGAVSPAVASPPAAAAEPQGDKAAPKDKGGAEKVADAKAPAGKTVQGNVVNEEPFSAWLQVTSPAKAGAPVQLEAVLVAKPPYHCNAEYPHKFKLNAAPAGLSYPEETVRGAKVTPERSVLAIPVNAQSAGKPTVAGTLSFSVCTEERCLVEKRDLSVALDVL